jgi:MerR family transcriptional regulator, thiopeptide resistance regulator
MRGEDGKSGVRTLARLAGVSVRTLHHYDRIGLLEPGARTAAGYRLYGPEQLLRLQQILFFRELDFPLTEIARVLSEPGFDPARALREHRGLLEARLGRLHRLLETLDRTLARYENKDKEGATRLTDAELYQGFTPEKIAAVQKEARARYGEAQVEASERKVKAMSKEQWEAVGKEGEGVNRDLAALVGRDPGDAAVQAVVARHHAWIKHFWTPDAESYRGLGAGYDQHPEFRAYYEKYAPGLAAFLGRAIARYCERFPG